MRAGANLVRYGIYVLVLLVLSACGGGGGGGGDSGPGSGGSLTVTPKSLVFNARVGVALPAPQTITASFTEPNVGALLVGLPPGSANPTWLSASTSGNSSPVQIQFTVTSVSMPANTYTTTIRLLTLGTDQSIISIRDVPITYVLSP